MRYSMLATGEQRAEDAQIRIRKQQALRLTLHGSCGPLKGAKMLAAGEGAKMVLANAGKSRDLLFGENFLRRFHSDHAGLPAFLRFCVKRMFLSAGVQIAGGEDPKNETLDG